LLLSINHWYDNDEQCNDDVDDNDNHHIDNNNHIMAMAAMMCNGNGNYEVRDCGTDDNQNNNDNNDYHNGNDAIKYAIYGC